MRKRQPLPTQARLKELFDYDPATGVLRAKTDKRTRRGAHKAGDVLGYADVSGYLKVTADGFPYAAHRIAWKWMTGAEPPDHIDHKNRVKHDNSWANLRASDKYANAANVAFRKAAGAKGVRPGACVGKWTAMITVRGETYYLGTFGSEEAARAAYLAKAQALRGFADETPYCPTVTDVIYLLDEPFLETALDLIGATRALCRRAPEHSRLLALAAEMATHMARVDPEKYGFLANRQISPAPVPA